MMIRPAIWGVAVKRQLVYKAARCSNRRCESLRVRDIVKRVDITGQRFGKLVATSDWRKWQRRRTQWLCLCDCGNQKYIDAGSLRSGLTSSCGCNKKDPAYRAAMSAKLSGRKLTPEWIANRSESRIKNGKGHSQEARANMSKAQKGNTAYLKAYPASVAARIGKPLTPEHVAKLIEVRNRYPLILKQAMRLLSKLRKSIHEKQD